MITGGGRYFDQMTQQQSSSGYPNKPSSDDAPGPGLASAPGPGLEVPIMEGERKGERNETEEIIHAADKTVSKLGGGTSATGGGSGRGGGSGGDTNGSGAIDAFTGLAPPGTAPPLATTTTSSSSHALALIATTSTDTTTGSVLEDLKFTKPLPRGQPGSRDEEDDDHVLLGTKTITLQNFNPIDAGDSPLSTTIICTLSNPALSSPHVPPSPPDPSPPHPLTYNMHPF